MIVVDTSLLYALLDRRDARHVQAAAWYGDGVDDLITTPLVLAETDHLCASRLGATALASFHRDVAAGAYAVEWWPSAAAEAVRVADRYSDLGIGLTAGSLVALAARVGTASIATFDERHFRAVRPLRGGQAFTLVPLDV